MLASGLFELFSIATGDSPGEESAGAIAMSTVIAFVVGYAAIAWLLRYISSHTLTVFVVYRIALGAIVLILAGSASSASGRARRSCLLPIQGNRQDQPRYTDRP